MNKSNRANPSEAAPFQADGPTDGISCTFAGVKTDMTRRVLDMLMRQ
jgi:hypothetical protein